MIKLLVLADDFTGALDTGVQFSKKNIKTFVTTDINISPDYDLKDAQVLVIDTESRHIPPKKAYEIIKKITQRFRKNEELYFYKKTDSTLRGNIGAELEGFMVGLKIIELPFVPAYPKSNRTTKNGYHYVGDLLLENSTFSKDPFCPMKESYIPKIISAQSTLETKVIFENSSLDCNTSEGMIFIYDCESDAEMKRIGEKLKEQNKLKYISGCAGFAEILGNIIEFQENKSINIIENNKFLLVSGSVNEMSQNQIKYAKNNGYEYYKLSIEEILANDIRSLPNYKLLVNTISDKLKKEKKFLIYTVDNYEEVKKTKDFAAENSLDLDKIGILIAKNIGSLTKDIVDRIQIKNLIIFGGDTLMGIADKLELIGIIPQKEIIPGVVYSNFISENKDYNLNIISKAGGFGTEDVVVEIEGYLRIK